MDIQLFLAHADDHQPVLADGLPQRSVYSVPRPDFEPPEPEDLENLSGPADALPEQRWAVIAPKGPAGDRLLGLIEPLTGGRPIQAFYSTCVEDTAEEVLAGYSGRWSIEEAIQGGKSYLGF